MLAARQRRRHLSCREHCPSVPKNGAALEPALLCILSLEHVARKHPHRQQPQHHLGNSQRSVTRLSPVAKRPVLKVARNLQNMLLNSKSPASHIYIFPISLHFFPLKSSLFSYFLKTFLIFSFITPSVSLFSFFFFFGLRGTPAHSGTLRRAPDCLRGTPAHSRARGPEHSGATPTPGPRPSAVPGPVRGRSGLRGFVV